MPLIHWINVAAKAMYQWVGGLWWYPGEVYSGSNDIQPKGSISFVTWYTEDLGQLEKKTTLCANCVNVKMPS